MTKRKPKPAPPVAPPVIPLVTQPKPITITQRNWLREAISDDQGLADMAYVVIGALAAAAIFALGFIFLMAAIDYHSCTPILTISTGTEDARKIVPCRFDALPIGQASGLIFGAFGALIAALAGYMAATRRAKRSE